MSSIRFQGETYLLEQGETVLDGLIRNDLNVSYGCKAGACHACIMQLESGQVESAAQKGLSSAQIELGLFLSCCCSPSTPIDIQSCDQELARLPSTVVSLGLLNEQILRIRLEPSFDAFKAGQYLNIWQSQNSVRSYSIASLPSDGFIELHVKVVANGRFSAWAKTHLKPGDSLLLQGPMGECFYTGNNKDLPLLLVGIGTGLAPLYGIVRDALEQGHRGDICLIVGARSAESFYLVAELLSLSDRYQQLTVRFVAQEGVNKGMGAGVLVLEDLYAYVFGQYSKLSGYRVYLCGSESFVGKMRKQCFMAGASMRDIHSDVFLPFSQAAIES